MYIIDVCCFLGKEILRFLLSNSTRWTVFMIQFTASSSTELPHEFLLNTPTKLFEKKFRKFFLIFTRLDNFRPLRLMLSCCVVLLTASRISAPLPIFFCQTVGEFYIVRSWKSCERGAKNQGEQKSIKWKVPFHQPQSNWEEEITRLLAVSWSECVWVGQRRWRRLKSRSREYPAETMVKGTFVVFSSPYLTLVFHHRRHRQLNFQTQCSVVQTIITFGNSHNSCKERREGLEDFYSINWLKWLLENVIGNSNCKAKRFSHTKIVKVNHAN